MGVAFVASRNLSRSALESGNEWNLRGDATVYTRVRDAFEALWLGIVLLDFRAPRRGDTSPLLNMYDAAGLLDKHVSGAPLG